MCDKNYTCFFSVFILFTFPSKICFAPERAGFSWRDKNYFFINFVVELFSLFEFPNEYSLNIDNMFSDLFRPFPNFPRLPVFSSAVLSIFRPQQCVPLPFFSFAVSREGSNRVQSSEACWAVFGHTFIIIRAAQVLTSHFSTSWETVQETVQIGETRRENDVFEFNFWDGRLFLFNA